MEVRGGQALTAVRREGDAWELRSLGEKGSEGGKRRQRSIKSERGRREGERKE